LQTLAVVFIQPFPLQLFNPVQAVVAVPHADFPLHEFIPEPFTRAAFGAALAILVALIPVKKMQLLLMPKLLLIISLRDSYSIPLVFISCGGYQL